MRIDSSGNLLVGTTDTNPANDASGTGVAIGNGGWVAAARDGDTSGMFNRLTSDGNIVTFHKDGSTVGTIGCNTARFYIHGSYGAGSGLRFDNASIRPATSTGASSDATTDLGAAPARFKDLYLSGDVKTGTSGRTTFGSGGFYDNAAQGNNVGVMTGGNQIFFSDGNGAATDNANDLGATNRRIRDAYVGGGVYLGGVAAANKLDDYEEGTFTPTLSTGVTSPTYTNQNGSYTKVGDVVYFQIRFKLASGTANDSQFVIGGLPFNSANTSDYGGAFISYSSGFLDDLGVYTIHIGPNANALYFYDPNGSSKTGNEIEAAGSVLGLVYINGFYKV
jgi:hypothetical protein